MYVEIEMGVFEERSRSPTTQVQCRFSSIWKSGVSVVEDDKISVADEIDRLGKREEEHLLNVQTWRPKY